MSTAPLQGVPSGIGPPQQQRDGLQGFADLAHSEFDDGGPREATSIEGPGLDTARQEAGLGTESGTAESTGHRVHHDGETAIRRDANNEGRVTGRY